MKKLNGNKWEVSQNKMGQNMKKRLLYFITLSEIGGAQKVVYQLIRNFCKTHKIYLVCPPNGQLLQWVQDLDSDVEIITLSSLKREISLVNDLLVFFKMIFILKKERIDILHCHSSKAGLIGRFAGWLAGTKNIIFTVHGWSSYVTQNRFAKGIYDFSEKLASLISTSIVCVTDKDRKYALDQIKIKCKKLHVINNGIDINYAQIPYLRNELGIDEGKIIIGTVARLSVQKNPLFTIEVYSEILKKNEQVIFIWIGDGPLKKQCYELIEKNGIGKSFILLGDRTDVEYLIPDFDIFSLLSDWESMPLSILEAMAAGLPVLASDVGGIRELVQDNINGVIIKNKDLYETREQIYSILADKQKRIVFGDNSRKLFLEKFTEDKMINEYLKLYNYK